MFTDDISITDAARITKLGIQMLHDESWGEKVIGQGHQICVGLQTEHGTAAAAAAHVAIPGFPCVIPRIRLPLGFLRRGFLHSYVYRILVVPS